MLFKFLSFVEINTRNEAVNDRSLFQGSLPTTPLKTIGRAAHVRNSYYKKVKSVQINVLI